MAKILVIDDDASIREFLNDVLSIAGYDVTVASNGAEGVKLYHTYDPDLVITDIVMPDKEGIEVIREFRKSNPQLKIIAISGGLESSPFYLQMADKMGANRTIQKPFENNKMVLDAVDQLLNE